MSYMRGPIYVWSDGKSMHLWRRYEPPQDWDYTLEWVRDCDYHDGVAIPLRTFDALVMMREAQLSAPRRRRAQQLALRWVGNFGVDRLLRKLGYILHGDHFRQWWRAKRGR